jgi:hypothetical protein
MCRFFLLFVYICIDVGDSIIKSGKGWDPRRFNHQVGEGLGSPEIQSSSRGRVGIPGDSIIKSGKGWDPQRFNHQVWEGLGSPEIQLSSQGRVGISFKLTNSTTFVCQSLANI